MLNCIYNLNSGLNQYIIIKNNIQVDVFIYNYINSDYNEYNNSR